MSRKILKNSHIFGEIFRNFVCFFQGFMLQYRGKILSFYLYKRGYIFMNSAAELWAKVLTIMSEELGMSATTISTWFDDANAVSLTGDKLVLVTPAKFKKNMILNLYQDKILEALKILFSVDMKFDIYAEEEISSDPIKKNMDQSEDYSFERFIVGDSNQLAHAAAKATAESPAAVYNPLLIYGGPGLGKTHLLNAIAGTTKKNNPNANVVYVNAELFTNELIECISNGDVSAFRNKYRNSDLLLVDDIQFIAGKERTQEEFFHTFNALYDAKKQIVLTSDRLPKEMATLEERLQSRFESGLMVDIQPPDYETRMAIISLKANRLGLNLSQELKSLIANSITANVRQLEGTVKKILAYRDLLSVEITKETVEKAISDMFMENPGLNPTPEMVVSEVSKFYQIEEDEIKGKNRSKNIVLARQVAMYLIRKMLNASFPDIAAVFDCDHTTVMHSYNKISEQCSQNEEFKKTIRDIKNNITGS